MFFFTWLSTLCILQYYTDYLKKVLIKINVATDEGNSRNEI